MIAHKGTCSQQYNTAHALSLATNVESWSYLGKRKSMNKAGDNDPYWISSSIENETYVGINNGREVRVSKRILQDSVRASNTINMEELFVLEIYEDSSEVYTTSKMQPSIRNIFKKASRCSRLSAVGQVA